MKLPEKIVTGEFLKMEKKKAFTRFSSHLGSLFVLGPNSNAGQKRQAIVVVHDGLGTDLWGVPGAWTLTWGSPDQSRHAPSTCP